MTRKTAEPSQLPFFVAACDYTLIGEELYAASAYLSREPVQLGTLRGQDIGKAVILSVIVIGIVLQLGVSLLSALISTQQLFRRSAGDALRLTN